MMTRVCAHPGRLDQEPPIPVPAVSGNVLYVSRTSKQTPSDLPCRKRAISHGKSHQSIVAIALAVALVIPSLATAQHPAALGDLMTAFVQPRHTKLGLAGAEQNWSYAAYELDQLRETLGDVAEILPKYRNLSIPDMITSTVKEPLAALNRAIQAKDADQFTAAYGQLTASCNTCHESYDRAIVVIQPPTVTAFPDQDFHLPKQ